MTAPQTLAEHRARLKTVLVEGGRIAYADEGPLDGPPVVLVHGMPDNSWVWRNVISELTRSGLRVIAPDLLGWGASDKPADLAEYEPQRQAARILALLAQLGLERWTQVCHDIGGVWTWELIDREPERIERLVVLNTTAYLDGWRVPGMLRVMGGPLGIVVLGAMASAVLGPRMTARMLRQAVARPERLTPAVVEGYWRPLHEGATQPFRQMLTSFDTVIQAFDRYAAALRRFDAPALIVWGGQDRVLDATKIPAQFARDLRVPPERVQVLPQAGHFLQEDEPAEVARLISEFVRADSASRGQSGR